MRPGRIVLSQPGHKHSYLNSIHMLRWDSPFKGTVLHSYFSFELIETSWVSDFQNIGLFCFYYQSCVTLKKIAIEVRIRALRNAR